MLSFFIRYKYAFPVAVAIFSVISYHAAIRKTLAAWQLNRQFKSELAAGARLDAQPGYMLRKQQNLSRIISHYTADSTTFRSAVIARTAQIAGKQGIRVSAVPVEEPLLQTSSVATERMVFTGSYPKLLRALLDLERTGDVGIVRSVRISLPRRTVNNPDGLEMAVNFQAIKKR